eukprot:2583236-Lingulodinium_polyedra.AAC.1
MPRRAPGWSWGPGGGNGDPAAVAAALTLAALLLTAGNGGSPQGRVRGRLWTGDDRRNGR